MNEIEQAITELKSCQIKCLHIGCDGMTMQMAISALEKQIPKKITSVGHMCPACQSYVATEPVTDHYCFSCGQALMLNKDGENHDTR